MIRSARLRSCFLGAVSPSCSIALRAASLYEFLASRIGITTELELSFVCFWNCSGKRRVKYGLRLKTCVIVFLRYGNASRRWREWKKCGGHAAFRRRGTCSRPSKTAARAIATRWAPRGDQRIRRFLPIRVLARSSTQPSALEVETGRPARCLLP